MVSARSISLKEAREPVTKVIRVGEAVYERLNELRLTKYGSRKSFTLVIAEMLETVEKRETR